MGLNVARKTIYPNIPQANPVASIAQIEKYNNNYFSSGIYLEGRQNDTSNVVIYTNNYNFVLDSLIVTVDTGRLELEIMEDSTITSNGSEALTYCLNRVQPSSPAANIFLEANVATTGTKIFQFGGNPEYVDINSILSGTIFKNNSIYLLRIIHTGTALSNIHINFGWSEG